VFDIEAPVIKQRPIRIYTLLVATMHTFPFVIYRLNPALPTVHKVDTR